MAPSCPTCSHPRAHGVTTGDPPAPCAAATARAPRRAAGPGALPVLHVGSMLCCSALSPLSPEVMSRTPPPLAALGPLVVVLGWLSDLPCRQSRRRRRRALCALRDARQDFLQGGVWDGGVWGGVG